LNWLNRLLTKKRVKKIAKALEVFEIKPGGTYWVVVDCPVTDEHTVSAVHDFLQTKRPDCIFIVTNRKCKPVKKSEVKNDAAADTSK